MSLLRRGVRCARARDRRRQRRNCGRPGSPGKFRQALLEGCCARRDPGAEGPAALSDGQGSGRFTAARGLGCRARPGCERISSGNRKAWTRIGCLLSLRSVADGGLLRREQADEGVHRFCKRGYQFPAVHGFVRRCPPARVRLRHRSRQLSGPRSGGPDCTRRLECGLVSSGSVPADDRGARTARDQDCRHRSAPNRDGRGSGPFSADRTRNGHGPVLRPARGSCR